MDFLRPTSRIEIPVPKNDQVSGNFGPPDENTGLGPYQITIWKESYGFISRYGIRFGKPNNPSWVCNDSYFEVDKFGPGPTIFVRQPEHLAKDLARCL